MATTPNSVVTPQALNTSFQSFALADTTTKKLLFTAGSNGSLVNSLAAASTDTTARNMVLWYYDGTTYWQLGCINIPLSAGNTGAIASVNLLSTTLLPGLPLDSNGNPYLKVKAGDSLYGSVLASVTSGLLVTVSALGEDY